VSNLGAERLANGWPDAGSADQDLSFAEMKGQQHVKRAVKLAAADSHNICLMSAPTLDFDLGQSMRLDNRRTANRRDQTQDRHKAKRDRKTEKFRH
jgi:hypothetical protein